MKASIVLSLRTREVYRLFERKISGDRFFIAAILHKINKVIHLCQNQDPQYMTTYHQMEQKILHLTQHFTTEIERFETLLAKKKEFDNKKATFIIQFRPLIVVSNPLTMQLIGLIETYDKLLATLKLLHLAGCFGREELYFGNIKRYQKMANQVLSALLLTKNTKLTLSGRFKISSSQDHLLKTKNFNTCC